MLDLPSVIVGAIAVVAGNVIVASLNHRLQSDREQKAHERQKERDHIAHEYRMFDDRLDRLRTEYLKILITLSMLRELATPAGVGTNEEAMRKTWQSLLEAKADLVKSRAALKLEKTSPPEVLALLEKIEFDVGAYVFGKQQNFKALQTELRPVELPFEDSELRQYFANIRANAEQLEQLLAVVVTPGILMSPDGSGSRRPFHWRWKRNKK